MLSHASEAYFWTILIQNWIKKNIVDQNLEGRAPVAPPSGSATDTDFIQRARQTCREHLFYIREFSIAVNAPH